MTDDGRDRDYLPSYGPRGSLAGKTIKKNSQQNIFESQRGCQHTDSEPCCHEMRKIAACHSHANKATPSMYFQDAKAGTASIINDSEFRINSETLCPKDSMVEQNMYQILHDHGDTIRGKCLEAKLPILRQSLYKKDFTPKAFSSVIRGAANNPWDIFKPDAKLSINSIQRVCQYINLGGLCQEANDSWRAKN